MAPAQPQEAGPAVLLGCAHGSIAFPFSPKNQKSGLGTPTLPRRYPVHRPLSLFARRPTPVQVWFPQRDITYFSTGAVVTRTSRCWRRGASGPCTRYHHRQASMFPLPIFPPPIETPAAELVRSWISWGQRSIPSAPSSRQLDHGGRYRARSSR